MSVTRTDSTERHLTAVETHDVTRAGRRPSTTPAYYQGRPAGLWLDVFGKGRRRSSAVDKPATARVDVPAAQESLAAHRPGHAA
jgi:hypothetical protein